MLKDIYIFLNFELIVIKDKNYYTTFIIHYIYITITDLILLYDQLE